MRDLWLIARHEYRRTVARRGFVIGTLAIPLGIVILVAAGVLVEQMGENRQPVGYVDRAGLLDPASQAALPAADRRVEVRAFSGLDAARAALEAGEIQAFFILPPDYAQTLQTDLYYLDEPPGGDAWRAFDDFVRLNLVASFPPEVRERLLAGPRITVRDLDSGRTFSEDSFAAIVLPIVASFFFFFATMSAASYMLRVVADEKENRTIEVVITSVTPGQLIGGKAAGLLAATLTQLLIYLVTIAAGLAVAAPHVATLRQVAVPWAYLGLMALFFLPAYVLVSAIMIAVGAAVTEVQQGQQVGAILNLFFMIPIFMLPVLIENPGHPAAVFMTLFPVTSFLTISLRWGLGTIPAWQLGVSWVLLSAAAIGLVWAAAGILRAGMLRYGQPLPLRAAAAAIRRRGR